MPLVTGIGFSIAGRRSRYESQRDWEANQALALSFTTLTCGRVEKTTSTSAWKNATVQSSAGPLVDCSCESSEFGASFPHSSKKRLRGSDTTALRSTPTIVRDTADQTGLSPSIGGTATATRMTGKNKITIASACVPGPLNGWSFHRLAKARIHRAAGAHMMPPNRTTGRGNSKNSSEPLASLSAEAQ